MSINVIFAEISTKELERNNLSTENRAVVAVNILR